MNEYGVFTCVAHGVYMCLNLLFLQGLQWEVRPYERVWCVYVCHSWCLHVFTYVVFSRAFSGKYVHMNEYGVFTCVIHGVYLCLRLLFFPGPSVGSTSIWTSMVCLRVSFMVFTCVYVCCFSRAFSGKYVHMNEYVVFTCVIHGVYLCLRLLFFPGPSVGSTSIWTSMVCLRVSFMVFTCVYVCCFSRAFSGKYVHMNEYGVFTCVAHGVYMCLNLLFLQSLQWEVRPYERVWCVYVCGLPAAALSLRHQIRLQVRLAVLPRSHIAGTCHCLPRYLTR